MTPRRILIALLIFIAFMCVLSYCADAQTDRQWVPRSTSGYSDTIYHTVIGVYNRPESEKTWIYKYALDSISHEVTAPKVVYQIDTHRVTQSLTASGSTIYYNSTGTFTSFTVDAVGTVSRYYHRKVSHRRKKKRHHGPVYWTSTKNTGSGSSRIRIKVKVFFKLPDGSTWEWADYNGTFKQWDSIGRAYILHRKYFQ